MLLVVGTHELGHFLAAKLLGVGVRQVILGLGKPLYTKTLNSGLVLGITPFPLGGYVTLFNEREAPLMDKEKSFSLTSQAPWRRIIIFLAGAGVNFLVAIFLFSLLFFIGFKQIDTTVSAPTSQSIAQFSGLHDGDKITGINGWETPNWSLLTLAILSHSGKKSPLYFSIIRNGQQKNLTLIMNEWHYNGLRETPLESLGITLPPKLTREWIQYSFVESFKKGLYRTWQYTALNVSMVGKIVTGKISLMALAGPLTLLDSAQSQLKVSFTVFLNFIALLSIAVGVVNLLPLPSLDGGHIVYVLLEKIRGRSVSIAMEVLIYRFMLAALFVFCMQLLANDLHKLSMP